MILSVSAQEKKVKTGWKFGGALPAISFDSDLGFQYGALVEFFNYGDGSTYPDYFDHTYTEVSHYTKGSGIYRFMYESNHLIPGVHMTSDLSYLPDQANHFYGFNGYESVFNKDWMDDELCNAYVTEQGCSIVFRGISSGLRTIFRENFQVNILNGVPDLLSRILKSVRLILINLTKGKMLNCHLLPDQPGLFERYQTLGLISSRRSQRRLG